MKKAAQKVKTQIQQKITFFKSLKHPQQRKKLHVALKYKLFLLERRWMTHPYLRYLYPKPGLARRLLSVGFVFIVVGSGFLIFLHSRASADWYNNIWVYRKQIVIDKSKVPSTQTNFPVMVSITDTSLAANTQSNGNDILFTSSDGTTKLSHEIESYNSSTGKLVAWVKIPTLSASANTIIYMYYGNASAASQQDTNNVWTGTNYLSVLHLNQSPLNSAPQMLDSTSNNTSGTANGSMDDTNKINAVANGGLSFNGTSNYISLGNPAAINSASKFTMTGWIRKHATGSDAMLGRLSASCTNNLELFINSGANLASFQVGNSGFGDASFNDTQWHHFAMVFDGTQTGNANRLKGYIDGVQQTLNFPNGVGSVPATTPNSTDQFDIAQNGVNACSGYGSQDTDEVRIATTNLSPDWITTEFNTEATPSAFMTVGSEQQRKNPVLYWKFDDGTANDTSTSGNSGVIFNQSGTATQSAALCGLESLCLKFNGANTYAKRVYASDSDLDPGTNSFSVGAWFRHPSGGSGTQTLVSRVDGNSVNGVGYKINYDATNARLCFGIDDTAGSFASSDAACAAASYADNKWHYVEGVKNGTTNIILYVDGVQAGIDSSIASTGSLSGSSPPFIVGIDGDSASNAWNGFIDEVKYYDYARSVAEIKADFNAKGSVLGASASFGLPSPQSSLNQDLAGYWPMDDSAGSPCPSGVNHSCDNSGNGNDGTWNGNVASASGKFGFGTSYNGTVGNYNSVPDTSTLEPQNDMTFSAWVKPSVLAGGSQKILYKNNTIAPFYSYMLEIDTTNHFVAHWQNSTSNDYTAIYNGTLQTGTWYLVTVVKQGNSLKIYVNGSSDNTTSSAPTGTLFNSNSNLFMGDNGSGTALFTGVIDDVRIYSRALSSSEVTNLYNWAPGPIGFWKLDDSAGTMAKDSSGNNYWANLINSPLWDTGKYGKGLKFDGLSNYGSVAHNSNLNLNGSFTIGFWARLNGTETGSFPGILSKGSFGGPISGANGWLIYENQSTRTLAFKKDTVDTGFTTTNMIDTTTMRYYTVVYNKDTQTLTGYVNGQQVNQSTSITFSPNTDTNNMWFAIGDNYGNFLLDDIRIYNYVRNPKQIQNDMNAGAAVVGKSAVGIYKFDDGYGNVASNSGSLKGTANAALMNFANPASVISGWTNEGEIGKALNFDGTNDLVSINGVASSVATGDMTVSGWFRFASTFASGAPKNQTFFGLSDSSSTNDFIIDFNSSTGKMQFRLQTGSGEMIASPPQTSWIGKTWYHVIAVYSQTEGMKVYINGRLAGVNANTTRGSATASTHANIGGLQDVGDFSGTLDEVRVYNYALTANEAKLEFNQGSAVLFGALSTNPDGYTASFSAARSYCPPGDSSSNCALGLKSGPVGEWQFDEGTGTSANDSSGNGNNATLTNSLWTTGKIGKALTFTSATSRVNAGSGTSLDNLPAITAEAWIYPTTNARTVNTIAMKGVDGALGSGWRFYYDATQQSLDFDASYTTNPDLSVETDASVVTNNRWQHVVVSWDGTKTATNVHLYINGIEQHYSLQTTGSTTRTDDSGDNFTMGSAPDNTNLFGGTLDNVRVYNYARTPAQVAWDYNRGRPTGWWKFDECNGTTAYDASGFGNNGAITITATGGNTNGAGTCQTATSAWGTGANGKMNASLNLDGNGDYVDSGAYSPNTADTNSYSGASWGGWVNPSAAPTSKTMMVKNLEFELITNANNQASCIVSNNGAAFGSTTAVSVNPIAQNQWTHVFCTYDGSTIKIYMNGRQEAATTFSATIKGTAATNLYIGRNNAGTVFFAGMVDDMRIYNYTLNATQIRTLINGDAAVRFAPVTGSP